MTETYRQSELEFRSTKPQENDAPHRERSVRPCAPLREATLPPLVLPSSAPEPASPRLVSDFWSKLGSGDRFSVPPRRFSSEHGQQVYLVRERKDADALVVVREGARKRFVAVLRDGEVEIREELPRFPSTFAIRPPEPSEFVRELPEALSLFEHISARRLVDSVTIANYPIGRALGGLKVPRGDRPLLQVFLLAQAASRLCVVSAGLIAAL